MDDADREFSSFPWVFKVTGLEQQYHTITANAPFIHDLLIRLH